MVEKYTAYITLLLPSSIQNLPFYNLSVNVDGGSIGSSYAIDIARVLFKDFEELWSIEQLKKLLILLAIKIFVPV